MNNFPTNSQITFYPVGSLPPVSELEKNAALALADQSDQFSVSVDDLNSITETEEPRAQIKVQSLNFNGEEYKKESSEKEQTENSMIIDVESSEKSNKEIENIADKKEDINQEEISDEIIEGLLAENNDESTAGLNFPAEEIAPEEAKEHALKRFSKSVARNVIQISGSVAAVLGFSALGAYIGGNTEIFSASQIDEAVVQGSDAAGNEAISSAAQTTGDEIVNEAQNTAVEEVANNASEEVVEEAAQSVPEEVAPDAAKDVSEEIAEEESNSVAEESIQSVAPTSSGEEMAKTSIKELDITGSQKTIDRFNEIQTSRQNQIIGGLSGAGLGGVVASYWGKICSKLFRNKK